MRDDVIVVDSMLTMTKEVSTMSVARKKRRRFAETPTLNTRDINGYTILIITVV